RNYLAGKPTARLRRAVSGGRYAELPGERGGECLQGGGLARQADRDGRRCGPYIPRPVQAELAAVRGRAARRMRSVGDRAGENCVGLCPKPRAVDLSAGGEIVVGDGLDED